MLIIHHRFFPSNQVSQANLPENIDFGLTRYGWGYSYYTLSAKDLRDEGVRLLSEFSLGNKKIRRNSNLDDSVYEELALNAMGLPFINSR